MWANIAQGNYLCNLGTWLTDNFPEQNNICNVLSVKLEQNCIEILSSQCCQMRLRKHSTRKLLVQCWLRAHRYTFAVKAAISNMSGGLFINLIQYDQTILVLFIQCWLRRVVGNGATWRTLLKSQGKFFLSFHEELYEVFISRVKKTIIL